MLGRYGRFGRNWQARSYNCQFYCGDAGTSAVEFAIILPVFLVILLGILSFGLYFGAAHSTAQLAADAARATVAGLNDAERSSIATKLVANTAANYPLLTVSKITVSAAPTAGDPSEFKVDVTFDASDLPIWMFADYLPLPPQKIHRSAVIRRGGF